MTVIVALKDKKENKIYLGCDGQGTSSEISVKWGRSKIIKLNIPITKDSTDEDCSNADTFKPLYIGVSGSHYLQSFLEYAFHPPCMQEKEEVLDYLYNQFFQSLNIELTNHTLLKNNEGALDSEAGLIMVFDGEIYNVYNDFSIVREANNYTCNGAGWKIAYAVLTNLLTYHNDMSCKKMVEEALATTGELNIYCNKDLTIEEIQL